MTVFTEGHHAAEFIMSEANGQLSRENVTVEGGFTGAGTLNAGTVLGKLTSGGKYVISPNSGSNGGQTGIAVLIYPIDITNGDVVAAIVARNAEVNGNLLTYDSTVNDATKRGTKATQLAAVGIIVR